jgi:hypothetical protein
MPCRALLVRWQRSHVYLSHADDRRGRWSSRTAHAFGRRLICPLILPQSAYDTMCSFPSDVVSLTDSGHEDPARLCKDPCQLSSGLKRNAVAALQAEIDPLRVCTHLKHPCRRRVPRRRLNTTSAGLLRNIGTMRWVPSWPRISGTMPWQEPQHRLGWYEGQLAEATNCKKMGAVTPPV